MFILKCVSTLFGLLIIVQCILRTHQIEEYTVGIKNATISNNGSSRYVVNSKRRAIIIINGDGILRSKNGKSKGPESLRYEEYDEDGKKLNSFMMYNLQDVADFFKIYLNTEICDVKCSMEV